MSYFISRIRVAKSDLIQRTVSLRATFLEKIPRMMRSLIRSLNDLKSMRFQPAFTLAHKSARITEKALINEHGFEDFASETHGSGKLFDDDESPLTRLLIWYAQKYVYRRPSTVDDESALNSLLNYLTVLEAYDAVRQISFEGANAVHYLNCTFELCALLDKHLGTPPPANGDWRETRAPHTSERFSGAVAMTKEMMENLLNSYNVKNHPTKTELMGLKVLQTYWEHLAFELPRKRFDSTQSRFYSQDVLPWGEHESHGGFSRVFSPDFDSSLRLVISNGSCRRILELLTSRTIFSRMDLFDDLEHYIQTSRTSVEKNLIGIEANTYLWLQEVRRHLCIDALTSPMRLQNRLAVEENLLRVSKTLATLDQDIYAVEVRGYVAKSLSTAFYSSGDDWLGGFYHELSTSCADMILKDPRWNSDETELHETLWSLPAIEWMNTDSEGRFNEISRAFETIMDNLNAWLSTIPAQGRRTIQTRKESESVRERRKKHTELYRILGVQTRLPRQGRSRPVEIMFPHQRINTTARMMEMEEIPSFLSRCLASIDAMPMVWAGPIAVGVTLDCLLQFTRCALSLETTEIGGHFRRLDHEIHRLSYKFSSNRTTMLEDFVDSIREYYSDDIDHWTLDEIVELQKVLAHAFDNFGSVLRLPALLPASF